MKENSFIDGKEQKNVKQAKKKSRLGKAARKQSQTFVQIMNGDFLTKDFFLNNLTYIFFVVFLLILMVSKGYYVNQLSGDISKTEEELSEITADFVETKAKLEERTRRTELIEKLNPLGLRETVNPTKVIRKKENK
ncbi:MAG: FtsL-like putative cell division protein [Brumimicrobium sp.]|nr:FtsL-like putative cell division protein [Brumimicrobium sp.]